MLTGHGNDIYDYDGKIRCDFSSNIPYRNASAEIAEHLKTRLHIVDCYPDPNARELTLRIAEHHNVSPEAVLVTNGSAEAFYLLAHLFSDKTSTVAYPAFAEYEDACRAYRHQMAFVPVKTLREDTFFSPGVAWLGVPNNPDGTIFDNDAIARFCRENPLTTFIIDAAYGELCLHCESPVPLHSKFRNLITVYSLTKTFGIPGLRLGYLIAEESVIEDLRRIRIPWSVNALALEAGSFIMENYCRLLPHKALLCLHSTEFQRQVALLPQLEVEESPCSFFLVRMRSKTAAELKTFLIENQGILIRDAANFRGLSAQHFRLSVQAQEWNDKLIRGMEAFFEK